MVSRSLLKMVLSKVNDCFISEESAPMKVWQSSFSSIDEAKRFLVSCILDIVQEDYHPHGYDHRRDRPNGFSFVLGQVFLCCSLGMF